MFKFLLDWFLQLVTLVALMVLLVHWGTGGQQEITDSERSQLSYCAPYDTSC